MPIAAVPGRAEVATAVAALALVTSLAADAVRAGGLEGRYDSPLGVLTVVENDGVVSARTAETGGPCGFPKGKLVLEGTRLDDNITGAFHVCKVGDGCSGEVSGMVMLLVTRSGAVMSGAVHVDVGSCKTPVGGDGIILKRVASRGSRKKPDGVAEGGKGPRGDADAIVVHDAQVAEARGGDSQQTTAAQRKGPKSSRRARAQARASEGAKLMEAGSIEEARAKFLDATKIDPSYSEGYVGVGVTYYMRDRYDEALDYYKQGLEANPTNRDAYYNTACVYALKGETEQALRYLRIAVLNGYVQLETLAQDPDLKSLQGIEAFEKLKRGEL